MEDIYASLLAAPVIKGKVAETAGKYLHITERHLQALWWEQINFKGLTTDQGEQVTVLSPGLWNESEGPDFRRAHLSFDGVTLRGDVEIHFTDEGWHAHGHDVNPVYNETVLHISLWPTVRPKAIITANGQTVRRLYLADQLTIPLEKILQVVDLDLYPYKPHLGAGRCAHTVFRKMPPPLLAAFFEGAALWRLRSKWEKLAALAPTHAAVWRLALAQSLGLPANALLFRRLASWLLENDVSGDALSLQSLCMGACGFFSSHYRNLWKNSAYYRHLGTIWDEHSSSAMPTFEVAKKRVRPLHHPVRRFVALVHLLQDSSLEERYKEMQRLWQTQWRECHSHRQWSSLWRRLRNCLPSYQDDYWETHYLFEERISAKPLPLLGTSIKNELLVNCFLPLLYGDRQLAAAASAEQRALLHLYRQAPATCHRQSHYLQYRFLGDTSASTLFQQAVIEQGALQLHSDFCRHFETSCVGCPFVERWQQVCPNPSKA